MIKPNRMVAGQPKS